MNNTTFQKVTAINEEELFHILRPLLSRDDEEEQQLKFRTEDNKVYGYIQIIRSTDYKYQFYVNDDDDGVTTSIKDKIEKSGFWTDNSQIEFLTYERALEIFS